MAVIKLVLIIVVINLGCEFGIAKSIKNVCADSLEFSLSTLKKCEGKPFKIIQSRDKRFQFIYYEKADGLVEYVHDKKLDRVCSMGPVDKVKTTKDEADCYPCGNSDC